MVAPSSAPVGFGVRVRAPACGGRATVPGGRFRRHPRACDPRRALFCAFRPDPGLVVKDFIILVTQSATFDLTDDSPHFVCHARRCAWPRSTSVSSAALLRARPRLPIRSATSQLASARPRPGPTTSPRAVAPGEKAPPVALTTGATRPPWRRFRRARVPRSSSRSRARHSARAPGTNRPRIHP